MKSILFSGLLFVSLFAVSFAQADNWADQCAGQPVPQMIMHYPVNVIPNILNGKITATVRKDIRCFKAGDILELTDPNGNGNYGKVKIEKVLFTTFNALSADIVSRAGVANMQALQQQLISLATAITTEATTIRSCAMASSGLSGVTSSVKRIETRGNTKRFAKS